MREAMPIDRFVVWIMSSRANAYHLLSALSPRLKLTARIELSTRDFGEVSVWVAYFRQSCRKESTVWVDETFRLKSRWTDTQRGLKWISSEDKTRSCELMSSNQNGASPGLLQSVIVDFSTYWFVMIWGHEINFDEGCFEIQAPFKINQVGWPFHRASRRLSLLPTIEITQKHFSFFI